jgi:hypothetical protein
MSAATEDAVGIRLACLGVVVTLVGCVRIPFLRVHRDSPRPPEAVVRFSNESQALGRAPAAADLAEATRSMSYAIEALPEVQGGDQLARTVRTQAEAMGQSAQDPRTSLDAGLEAVRRAKSNAPKGSKEQAVEQAQQAIEKIAPDEPATVDAAYRQVARAMVVVTGGGAVSSSGSELSRLVARFAVDEPDNARRTGAQAIVEVADQVERLPFAHQHEADDLRKKAGQLAAASPLDYAPKLKEALTLAIKSLDRESAPAATRQLLDEARVAVDAIRPDRPLELQRPAAQEALRLVADAITVSRR